MNNNEILTDVIKEFMDIVDSKKSAAEDAVENYDEFYEFVENNDQLKEYMYGFFYKLLDDYISFRFYHYPIPALADDENYMAKYKEDTLNTAKTFFNFGGIAGVN